MSEASPNDAVLLGRLVRAFGGVPGIRAIVLGGSRARGEAGPDSDYDIGLYYEPDSPIDIGRLAKAAVTLPGAASSSVTAIGEWGPWINGGAWLTVDHRRVDLLYRDLGKVRSVIEACRAGRIERAYQPGHPHAFVSPIYMGEVALCRILWDPDGMLAPLKRRCDPYPPELSEALIRTFFWEARFARENAQHGRAKDDPTGAIPIRPSCRRRRSEPSSGRRALLARTPSTGAPRTIRPMSRAVPSAAACLAQTLYALNRVYLLNEKGAVPGVERLARKPANFAVRVQQGLPALVALVEETAGLLKA